MQLPSKIKSILFLMSFMPLLLKAQNEGRFGIYSGVSYTTLMNADDDAYGDYLPTYKPTTGLSAAYHFTLFKKLPLGFSFQAENARAGQNYRGNYVDSTSYYAYTRLNYYRIGLAFHVGTNPRRQVALSLSSGVNFGFLASYQDRYELIRYNNDRYILDIKNNNVNVYDKVEKTGSLRAPYYNNMDMLSFTTLGLDFLLSPKLVFGFHGRFDYGFKPVETNNDNAINLNTNPAQVINYQPNRLQYKYRGPYSDKPIRSETTNMAFGVFLSLKYRMYNKEKIEFWYKEKNF